MSKEISVQEIKSKIIHLPGRPPVILDRMLAEIYSTDTRSINQAAKRNLNRFPGDFRFQLIDEETEILVSKAVLSRQSVSKSNPYGYTREGCNMMSACLETPVAVGRSLFIMRAFSEMEAYRADMKFSNQITGDQFDISAKRFITAMEVVKLAGIKDEHEARQTANRITKQTTGVDLLQFISSGIIIPPPKFVQVEAEDPMVNFVNIWWEKYGEEAIDSHYLLQMIIESDIPVNIGKVNKRSQKTRISRMLGKIKDQKIGSYYILEAGVYRNAKLWKLKPVKS